MTGGKVNRSMRAGVVVFGLASIAAGIMDLAWGEFEAAHQPIQALGDNIPGVQILAHVAAIWLIVGGAAILFRRTARFGAAALAVIYAIFGAFSLPRLYTAPHFLGHRFGVYAGVLVGIGQQLILVVAAVVVWASFGRRGALSPRAALAARWIFGLSTVVFGLAHLAGVKGVGQMVPQWMPLGGEFWAAFTGIAFVLAGLAIVSGVQDVLAARLLALMLFVFSATVLAPMIFARPSDHIAWGGNAYNLAAVGAAWIMAEWMAR
jgi:uncharacterized membrane protein YphA (DoxX/SURF4 family)